MKQLEIIEESETIGIKSITGELTKEDALLMLLNAYIRVCDACDVDAIKLLVSNM